MARCGRAHHRALHAEPPDRRRRARAQHRDDGGRCCPGRALRPHVKAHKSTALAAAQTRRATRTSRAPRRARSKAWPPPGSATICCWPTRSSTPRRLRRDGRRSDAPRHRRRRLAGDDRRRRRRRRREVLDRRQRRPPPLRHRARTRPARWPTQARARRPRGARRDGLRGPRRRQSPIAPSDSPQVEPPMELLLAGPRRRRRRPRVGRRHRHLRHQLRGPTRSRPAATR